MDFESSLRPGEKVIWSAAIEKREHDAATKPAPPIRESKPRMCGTRDECADVGAFRFSDEQVVKRLREKWGVGL
jgi:hypothetical protein